MERILADALGQDVSKLATQEKQRLLGRLLARVAHEVRNPLSSLAIHVQLLEEDVARAGSPLQAQTAGRFEIIRSELQRLENLMRQFLSLAGPSSADFKTVIVPEIVRYVCDLLRPEAGSRGIELVAEIENGIPPLTADPAQLKQVVINLVINAIQAVERNGRIEVRASADPGHGVCAIRVSDNGPGVPGEKRTAIFEPFFTTKSEGSGLGLWIALQIATAHGGSVTVDDRPDGGAAFTIRLPLDGRRPATLAGAGEDGARG